MACQRQPATPPKRFLPLPDVPDLSPPLAGCDARRRRSSTSFPSYDPQNHLPSPLFQRTYPSLSSTFTAQSQDDLLTPTDVFLVSALAPADPPFAYHVVLPECSDRFAGHVPAYPCTAPPPAFYSEALKWGFDLPLGAEKQRLPYSGDVSPTFEQPHLGTCLGLYIPQTDEPSRSRPWGPSVDASMDCQPEQQQMRASEAASAPASCSRSSPGRPILRRVPKLLDNILLATSSSVAVATC